MKNSKKPLSASAKNIGEMQKELEKFNLKKLEKDTGTDTKKLIKEAKTRANQTTEDNTTKAQEQQKARQVNLDLLVNIISEIHKETKQFEEMQFFNDSITELLQNIDFDTPIKSELEIQARLKMLNIEPKFLFRNTEKIREENQSSIFNNNFSLHANPSQEQGTKSEIQKELEKTAKKWIKNEYETNTKQADLEIANDAMNDILASLGVKKQIKNFVAKNIITRFFISQHFQELKAKTEEKADNAQTAKSWLKISEDEEVGTKKLSNEAKNDFFAFQDKYKAFKFIGTKASQSWINSIVEFWTPLINLWTVKENEKMTENDKLELIEETTNFLLKQENKNINLLKDFKIEYNKIMKSCT